MIVTDEPLSAILAAIRAGELVFEVLDPDLGRGHYAGEVVTVDGVAYRHRPWRVWVELADRLGLRLRTPRPATPPRVVVAFEPVDSEKRWDQGDKYAAGGGFARISKLEDPGFVLDFLEALDRIGLAPGARVLDLGCHRGELFELLPGALRTGVDREPSALVEARQRFPDATFVEADLGALPELGTFDLVITVGTLQSPGVDDRALLRHIVQRLLAPGGAVILGLPNCRYVDGEVQPGARVKNLREAELSLVIRDAAFYRRYLAQHWRRVYITGTRYLLVTGVASKP